MPPRDHDPGLRTLPDVTSLVAAAPAPEAFVHSTDHVTRLEAVFSENYALVWRLLRRFGVPAGEVDDAAQQVFMIFARKLDGVVSGKERAFLYGAALKTAANSRRSAKRRAKVLTHEAQEPASWPDELTEAARARELLDQVLAELPDPLRRVLVLVEVEQYRVDEVAVLERIPRGTAASRLRRAREEFRKVLATFAHRNPFEGGDR